MPKQRLLVVEDEARIRAMLRRYFETEYDVALAPDGQAGVAMAKRLHPHLILLDLRMPGLSGLDVLRRLKMSPETVGIPIVVLSALSDSASLLDAQALGATDYFIKPVALADIRHAMRKIIPTYLDGQHAAADETPDTP